MSKLKGLKVSLDTCSGVKKGIGAKNLKDLKEKIASKFDLSAKKKIFVFLTDGTEVDDDEYFDNLAPQTHLVASTTSTLATSSMTSQRDDLLDQFFHSLRWHGGARDAVERIRELLIAVEDDDVIRRWQAMASFVQEQPSKLTLFRLVGGDTCH